MEKQDKQRFSYRENLFHIYLVLWSLGEKLLIEGLSRHLPQCLWMTCHFSHRFRNDINPVVSEEQFQAVLNRGPRQGQWSTSPFLSRIPFAQNPLKWKNNLSVLKLTIFPSIPLKLLCVFPHSQLDSLFLITPRHDRTHI